MHQWNQEENGSGQSIFPEHEKHFKRMSLGVRKRVLQCYIEPILLYGCESWSMTKQTLTSIEAMEMWFLRIMLRVSWTEKRTNVEILNTAGSTRKLISNVKRRQAEFLGHVMRKGKLEHLLSTGKIEGKRSRGRQRIKIQDGIAAWLGRNTAEMFVDARDREKWKVMIAYACNRHGNWRRRRLYRLRCYLYQIQVHAHFSIVYYEIQEHYFLYCCTWQSYSIHIDSNIDNPAAEGDNSTKSYPYITWLTSIVPTNGPSGSNDVV